MRRTRITTLATVVAATSLLVGGAVSAQSPAASMAAPGAGLKVGVVTDVGTLDDHNFNQYSWEGAQRRRAGIGAPAPDSIVTTHVGGLRQEHPDVRRPDGYNVIVTIGFALGADTTTGRQGQPGHHVHRRRPGHLRRRDRAHPDCAPFACAGDAGHAPARTTRASSSRRTSRATSRASWPPASARASTSPPSAAPAPCPRSPNYINGYAERRQVGQPEHQGRDRQVRLQRPRQQGLQRPGRRQGVRSQQLLAAVPGHRRHVPGRRQDRQRRPPGRVRRQGIHGIGVDVDQFCLTPEYGRLHRGQRREEAHPNAVGQRIVSGGRRELTPQWRQRL